MFNFMGITQVKRYENNGLYLSVIRDNGRYEFALSHPLYNDDKLIIIGRYDFISQAITAYDHYLDLFMSGKYPISINGYYRKGL